MISILSSNSQLNFYFSDHIFNFHVLLNLLFLLPSHCRAFSFSYRCNIHTSLSCIYTKANFSHYLLLIDKWCLSCNSELIKGLKGNFNASILRQRYWLHKAITHQLTRLIQAEWRMMYARTNNIWQLGCWFSGVVRETPSGFVIVKMARMLYLCWVLS